MKHNDSFLYALLIKQTHTITGTVHVLVESSKKQHPQPHRQMKLSTSIIYLSFKIMKAGLLL